MSIYFERTYQRAFGTYPLREDACRQAIADALTVGYRAIDTAQAYRNEAEVGESLAQSGVARDDLCITTKVSVENFPEDRFVPSVERSLRDLRVDFVDVLLVHWAPGDGQIAPSLRLLQKAQDQKLTRHIGVSNYTSRMMRQAKTIVESPLVTNQVEFHPLLDQETLLAAGRETGIPLASYCSVARGKVFENPMFSDIGRPHGKSAAQVVLRWIVQKGVSLNTMSTKPDNICANFDIMDFSLSNTDMMRIDAEGKANHRIVGRNSVPWAPEWD